jgi:RNA polymerase sigma factor (sigma-70 family)
MMEFSISAYDNLDMILRNFYMHIKERDSDSPALYSAINGAGESTESEGNAYEIETERLLDDYGNSILRLAYSYLHNMADAEDVLQDTFIQYLKAAPHFRTPAHERNWLLRVAGNLSKNRIDYNRVRQSDELSDELAAEGREDLSFVWEAVKSLPVMYREVIHLYYYEGYPTAEIAVILKEKDSTVRSHLSRGRDKLREILKEAYDFG